MKNNFTFHLIIFYYIVSDLRCQNPDRNPLCFHIYTVGYMIHDAWTTHLANLHI